MAVTKLPPIPWPKAGTQVSGGVAVGLRPPPDTGQEEEEQRQLKKRASTGKFFLQIISEHS